MPTLTLRRAFLLYVLVSALFTFDAVKGLSVFFSQGVAGYAGDDVGHYRLAAIAYFQHGQNPYQASVITHWAQQDIGRLEGYTYLPFLYNPLGLLLLHPLQALPLREAQGAIYLLNFILAIATAWLLYRLLAPAGLPTWLRAAVTAVTVVSPAMYCSLNHGQINVLLTLALLGSLAVQQRKGRLPAWLWFVNLFLMSIKIQFTVMLLPFLLFKANWRPMLIGTGAMVVFLAGYMLWQPAIFGYYADALAGRIEGGSMATSPVMQAMLGSKYNWSLSGNLRRLDYYTTYLLGGLFELRQALLVFSVFSAAVLGWMLYRFRTLPQTRAFSLVGLMAMLGMWAFSFGPLSWYHYLIFLMPFLVLAAADEPGNQPAAWAMILTPTVVYLVPKFFGDYLFYDYPMVSRALPGAFWFLKNGLTSVLAACVWALTAWAAVQRMKEAQQA